MKVICVVKDLHLRKQDDSYFKDTPKDGQLGALNEQKESGIASIGLFILNGACAQHLLSNSCILEAPKTLQPRPQPSI